MTTLAPLVTTTCLKTYTLTQADVNAGVVNNSASVAGNPPVGPAVTAADNTSTAIPRRPGIILDKQAGTPTGNVAGSTIGYTFIVTNTGNVTLNPISITDPKVGAITCPVTNLAPAVTTTCTKTYTLTQNDVNAGHVSNTANVIGTPPAGVDPPAATDSTDTPIAASPAITLDKQAGTRTGNTAGSTIPYTFIVTNTGNVTLDQVSVADPRVGPVVCPLTVLAPAGTTTCTKTYALTQADVDSGSVVNTATATGSPPVGAAVSAGDSTTTTITRTPSISLDKRAGTPSGNVAGSTIRVHLHRDQHRQRHPVHGAGVRSESRAGHVPCCHAGAGRHNHVHGDLYVDASRRQRRICRQHGNRIRYPSHGSSRHRRGHRDNADSPGGGDFAGQAGGYADGQSRKCRCWLDDLVYLHRDQHRQRHAEPDLGVRSGGRAGELSDGESGTGGHGDLHEELHIDAGRCGRGSPREHRNCNGPAAERRHGSYRVGLDRHAHHVCSGHHAGQEGGCPERCNGRFNDRLHVLVTNTGNVTLNPVRVSDPLVGAVDCPEPQLAPQASTTCTALYSLTQDDVDAGVVDNTATAIGTPPSGEDVTAQHSTSTPLPANPVLAMDKQAATPSGSSAGDTVGYAFVLTNNGNVTLTQIQVEDSLVGAVTCPQAELAPAESIECEATYSLTQADVDSGHIANSATAIGSPPRGADVTASDSTDTPIEAGPAITLDKRGGSPSGNTVGSTIEYTFIVSNPGNVTLTTVGVSDPKAGAVVCPEDTLAPGASTTCTASYSLTQDDINAGIVTNVATATGSSPTHVAVHATDQVSTTITRSTALAFDKQADTPSGTRAGDFIDYRFIVTNLGNVTLDPVTFSDPKVGDVTCPVDVVEPEETITCNARYTMTQADVDAGHVANTATVTGRPPAGSDRANGYRLDGHHDRRRPHDRTREDGWNAYGCDRRLDDHLFLPDHEYRQRHLDRGGRIGPEGGRRDLLGHDPGTGGDVHCEQTYSLTQADVDAGQVANTATASGTPPSGPAVSAFDSTLTTIAAAPEITLDKQSGAPSGNGAGDTIDYLFVVTNTGNVTLAPITLDDPLVGAVTCPAVSLAPTTSMTCEATYSLTQSDVDSGHFANTATVTGTPPTGPDVTATDGTDTAIPGAAAITLDKQAASPTGRRGGRHDRILLRRHERWQRDAERGLRLGPVRRFGHLSGGHLGAVVLDDMYEDLHPDPGRC